MMALEPRVCRECGTEFQPKVPHAEFCCSPCRLAFNNRRMQRGAELYDLFMVMRYERGAAKALGLWAIMCRMAQAWRAEDDRQRGGRKSWAKSSTLTEKTVRYAATKGRI